MSDKNNDDVIVTCCKVKHMYDCLPDDEKDDYDVIKEEEEMQHQLYAILSRNVKYTECEKQTKSICSLKVRTPEGQPNSDLLK